MNNPDPTRLAQLVELLALRSARRGQFTLASGQTSDLYIDARLTTMHPDGLALIGPLALAALDASDWGRGVTAVGGLTLGADPIAYAMSYASALQRTRFAPGIEPAIRLASADRPTPATVAAATSVGRAPLRAFTVRKEAKTHGTGKLVEGPFEVGDRVAIIEDVITTGGSARRAIDAVRAAGGVVAGVLALVDREEGGRQAIEAMGLQVLALVVRRDIVARMEGEQTGAP
jgi:orotate phosphoribosyltransferase